MTRPLIWLSLLALVCSGLRASELPATQLARPGKLLVEQNFEAPPPPYDPAANKTGGFASGFQGWRWNAVPRGGVWKVEAGTFVGTETPSVQHPATASYGFDFQDVIIQCELKLVDAPLEGRRVRFMDVRTTDEKDYLCRVHLQPDGFSIEKSDHDHGGPDKAVPLGSVKMPLALDEWHTVTLEISGERMAATVDGHTLAGTHPLIGKPKKSIMFVAGVVGAVRHFRVWEALPK